MGRLRSLLIPGVDQKLLVKDAARLLPDPARRRFIAGGASLGALTLLTGCDVTDSFSADDLLAKISKFNDAVQAAIFNPTQDIRGEARIVERAFGIGASALAEAVAVIGEQLELQPA